MRARIAKRCVAAKAALIHTWPPQVSTRGGQPVCGHERLCTHDNDTCNEIVKGLPIIIHDESTDDAEHDDAAYDGTGDHG